MSSFSRVNSFSSVVSNVDGFSTPPRSSVILDGFSTPPPELSNFQGTPNSPFQGRGVESSGRLPSPPPLKKRKLDASLDGAENVTPAAERTQAAAAAVFASPPRQNASSEAPPATPCSSKYKKSRFLPRAPLAVSFVAGQRVFMREEGASRRTFYEKALVYATYFHGLKHLKEDSGVDTIQEEELGSGEFGTAYLATKGQKLVVLKILHFKGKGGRTEPQMIANLTSELILYARLKYMEKFPIRTFYNFERFLNQEIEENKNKIKLFEKYAKDEFVSLRKYTENNFCDGFYEMEYFPECLGNNWQNLAAEYEAAAQDPEQLKKFEQELQEKNSLVFQLKLLFQQSWDTKTPADIDPRNLAIQENPDKSKRLMLIDLYYQIHDGNGETEATVFQKLRRFATEESPLWRYLLPVGALDYLSRGKDQSEKAEIASSFS